MRRTVELAAIIALVSVTVLVAWIAVARLIAQMITILFAALAAGS